MYQIEITNTAHHHLRNLSHINQRRLHEAIKQLCQNPRPDGVKKLKGAVDFYRIRVGDYRILYEIDDTGKLIIVVRVLPRENAYWSH
jgi:mRNA interferase RelE/StbE